MEISNTVFIKYFLHCVFKELILLTDLKCFVCKSNIKKNMTGVLKIIANELVAHNVFHLVKSQFKTH